MWRSFLFRGSGRLGCLCRLDPLRERIESRPQRRYLLLLPIDDIAELDIGALQEGYFCLNSLDCIAVHPHSVTNPRPPPGRQLRTAQQLKPNWRFSCTDRQRTDALRSFACTVIFAPNACFSRPAEQIKH